MKDFDKKDVVFVVTSKDDSFEVLILAEGMRYPDIVEMLACIGAARQTIRRYIIDNSDGKITSEIFSQDYERAFLSRLSNPANKVYEFDSKKKTTSQIHTSDKVN